METRFCCGSFIYPLYISILVVLMRSLTVYLFVCSVLLPVRLRVFFAWSTLSQHTIVRKMLDFFSRYLLSFAVAASFLFVQHTDERKFTAKMIVFSVKTVLFFFFSFSCLCNWLHCCCRSALINFSHTALEAKEWRKKKQPPCSDIQHGK